MANKLASVRVNIRPQHLERLLSDAAKERLEKAGAILATEAKKSMRRGGGQEGEPSAPGEPPNVQSGTLRSSIQSAIENETTVVVGPTEKYGKYHEFGTRMHPQRPFMRPAYDRKKREILEQFEDMI